MSTAETDDDGANEPTNEVSLSASESENEGPSQGPRPSTEKRRADRAIFSAWVAQEADTIYRKREKQSDGEKKAEAENENLSIQELMARHATQQKITNPREYQRELCERAKTTNTIAVLDTGSGKTHIATMLLQHVIDEELELRAAGKHPRVAFFLVDSVSLVFQQSNVLQANLAHSIGSFCGAMGTDLWDSKTWAKHLSENMVIVCTAEVLNQCLMHSFTKMANISILIFDEAHHAKKNHPYAEIIKHFYLEEPDRAKRPKIFGMTASPVDSKEDATQAAQELEALLQSTIATASDLSLAQHSKQKAKDRVVRFDRLREPYETDLHRRLKSEFGHMKVFESLFFKSKEASSKLGSWCSDMYWNFALSEKEAKKKEARVEMKLRKTKTVEEIDDEVKNLRRAAEIVQAHDFRVPKVHSEDLSSKVIELHSYLARHFDRPNEHRCLVFVEERHTARLLRELFRLIGWTHLRSAILIGSTLGRDFNAAARNSVKEQISTITKFRSGQINCIFATSVAEEGLDIPECNLVVRFDLYKTMIQYIQSRGRARHSNSRYLHMIETGDTVQAERVLSVIREEERMRAWCQQLPADRLLAGVDDDLNGSPWVDRGYRSYTDPKTGAKLTYGSSLSVLAHFVSLLPQVEDTPIDLEMDYNVFTEAGKFVCEVKLPENSPVRSAIGRAYPRKSAARRSAAFEACILLRKQKLLDEHLLPAYVKRLPHMREAQLALSMKKSNMYSMRMKPEFWDQDSMPSSLYLTIIDLKDPPGRPRQPIGLLARKPLPTIPEFPLYLDVDDSSKQTMAVLKTFEREIKVTPEELERLTTFTLRVYYDIFHKVYENEPSKVSYWLVTILPSATNALSSHDDPLCLVDFAPIQDACSRRGIPFDPDAPADSLVNKFIVDEGSGGRRFVTAAAEPNLRASDEVPYNVMKGPSMMLENSIVEYSCSLYRATRKTKTWNMEQPVFRAEKTSQRYSLLTPPNDKELAREKKLKNPCYICLEPLLVSVIPVGFMATCLAFPAMIHRIEQYLIAAEAAKALNLDIGPELALEALTKDSDNTEEHEKEQINFKRGMGNNYERLEFLGDCFLKMATSISLHCRYAADDEYHSHTKRKNMICNKNMFENAVSVKLYEYVRSQAFSRRTWYQEGLKLIKGKGAEKGGESVYLHSLGDKTIADVCEALIGAAFLEHNNPEQWRPSDWTDAVKAVSAVVASSDHTQQQWSEYAEQYRPPLFQLEQVTAPQRDMAAKVEAAHPYHFEHPRLLRCAFMHPSYPFSWERIPSYQRLEFLGDSLFDMVCISHLFYRFPDKDPQWLTEHKMAMVANKFLGAVAVKLGFHQHLRANHSDISSQITQYVNEIDDALRESDGARDYWTTVKNPPKCLPDVVEAYIGAVFIDSGFDYNEVQRFFDLHIKYFFEDMSLYDSFANNHPTTRLHHMMSIELGCRDYRLMSQVVKAITPGAEDILVAGVLVHGKVVASSSGTSSRYAKVRASSKALGLIEGLPQYEYRKEYGCDCVERTGDTVEIELDDDVATAI
ncbi:dicer-like protein 1 [Aulographum hederae CBS 113979]|uniref:Dicer-like protein 1 n=1 Tax=Aulographum hederae CBS 113979 TaxID=1176131 RepID=A0A6G1GMK7_9PEZI|nr:dicer-like protein 1 [Aulographum hederae CBS 113979]